jgi:coenzyme F420-reducing hydrogenase gamma subunit
MVTPLKKIRVGWFSFSCSEDSTIVFTELLNDYWQEWKEIFDFRYMRILKSHNILDELDVAFIEGAIASKEQIERLKEIRAKSKKLVAVGSCAVTGLPAGQRNTFNNAQKLKIQPLITRFDALPKVLKVSDVVAVDAEVPGCPMDQNKFLEVLKEVIGDVCLR